MNVGCWMMPAKNWKNFSELFRSNISVGGNIRRQKQKNHNIWGKSEKMVGFSGLVPRYYDYFFYL